MQGITEKQYNEFLLYAKKLLFRRNLLINEFDLVHSAIVMYGGCTQAKIKKIFYDEIGYVQGKRPYSKHIWRLTQTKICKGCPGEGPLPVSMFYVCRSLKTNRVFLSTYCCVCNSKKSSEHYKKVKHNKQYKAAHCNASKRYYERVKNDPTVIKKRKATYREKMRDPSYREKRRLYTANSRLRNNKGRKTVKSNLSLKERRRLAAKKHYEKTKNDPVYKEKRKQWIADWRARVKDDPAFKEKNKKRYQERYAKKKSSITNLIRKN